MAVAALGRQPVVSGRPVTTAGGRHSGPAAQAPRPSLCLRRLGSSFLFGSREGGAGDAGRNPHRRGSPVLGPRGRRAGGDSAEPPLGLARCCRDARPPEACAGAALCWSSDVVAGFPVRCDSGPLWLCSRGCALLTARRVLGLKLSPWLSTVCAAQGSRRPGEGAAGGAKTSPTQKTHVTVM